MAAGDYYTLALSVGGQVFEWGDTADGNTIAQPSRLLSFDDRRSKVTSVAVTSPGYYHDRSSQRQHAAALCEDGALFMWGDNMLGQCMAIWESGVEIRPPDSFEERHTVLRRFVSSRMLSQRFTLTFFHGSIKD